MKKIAVVILNYLTYEDTSESVVSLNDHIEEYSNLTVYIVDNKCDKNKIKQLQSGLLIADIKFKIIYLSSEDNLGFARGMNLGIVRAREDGFDFIICSNNDVLYNKKIDFIKFIDIYENNHSIALIGPKILEAEGYNLNPDMLADEIKENYLTTLKQKFIFTNFLGKIVYFARGYKSFFFGSCKGRKYHIKSQEVYCLHGSYFTLTPSYFQYYEGLDPNTFLYGEELILAERIKQQDLITYYTDLVEVFHKSRSSTNKIFGGNSIKKATFILNEMYISRKYFLKKYMW